MNLAHVINMPSISHMMTFLCAVIAIIYLKHYIIPYIIKRIK